MKKENEINYWKVYPTRMWILSFAIAIAFGALAFAALLYVVGIIARCA